MFRAIDGRIQIEMVVPHAKHAESSYVLGQTAVDERTGVGSRSVVASDPRVAPRWRAVPKILDGGIVIEINAVNEFLAAHLRLVRETDVRVVAGEVIILHVVRHL